MENEDKNLVRVCVCVVVVGMNMNLMNHHHYYNHYHDTTDDTTTVVKSSSSSLTSSSLTSSTTSTTTTKTRSKEEKEDIREDQLVRHPSPSSPSLPSQLQPEERMMTTQSTQSTLLLVVPTPTQLQQPTTNSVTTTNTPMNTNTSNTMNTNTNINTNTNASSNLHLYHRHHSFFLPNLIVIGSPKCGTSSFSVWLFQRGKLKRDGGGGQKRNRKQPQHNNNIFCGGKVYPNEPSFFSKEIHYFDIDERYNQGISFYSKRFQHCYDYNYNYNNHHQLKQQQIIHHHHHHQQQQQQQQQTTTMLVDNKIPMYVMDGTPNYHQFPDRIAETYSHHADADADAERNNSVTQQQQQQQQQKQQQSQKDQLKLILLLRHPVARILSWYNHMKNTLYQEYIMEQKLQLQQQQKQKQKQNNNKMYEYNNNNSFFTTTYRTKYRYAIVTIQGNTIESSRELYLIRKKKAFQQQQQQLPLLSSIRMPQQPSNLITTPLKFKTFHEYVVDIVIPLLETVDHTPTGSHTVPFDKYGYHISNWFQHFKSSQLLVLSYDEMITNPKKLQQRVNQYLGLNLLTDGIFPVVNTQDSSTSSTSNSITTTNTSIQQQQKGGTGTGTGGRGLRDDTDTGYANTTTTNNNNNTINNANVVVVEEDIVNGVLNPSKTKYPTCETFTLLLKYLQPELDLFYTIMNNLTITERPSMQPYPFPQFQIPKCI